MAKRRLHESIGCLVICTIKDKKEERKEEGISKRYAANYMASKCYF